MRSVDARKAGSVLFVDDEGWDSFDQVAVALKRRGVHTVRVTTVPPARFQHLLREPHLRWLSDRLFYDELIHLGADEGRARLRELLHRGEVFDVVTNEPTVLRVGLETAFGKALTARGLAFHGTSPEALLDKFTVNEALARAGMDTPRQLRARDVSPAEAVRRLGLPLVIKHPIGASGEGVRVAGDLSEVETHLQDLGGDEASIFYQEHLPGKVVLYCAVVGPDGVRMEHGFRVERAQCECGPSAEVTLYDQPKLLDVGRRATALFGPQGFVSLGFIEAAGGRFPHIDANIRPWGMIAAPLGLGIDFTGAYAALVLGTPPPDGRPRKPTSAPLPIFPHRVFAPAEAGRARDAVSGAAAMVGTCAGALGLPYCAYTVARALLLAARGLRERRAARRSAVAAVGPPASVVAQAQGLGVRALAGAGGPDGQPKPLV